MSKSALKILSTAETLFNQHSFAGVGVDLIRDESGCSKTTMYTYFKNKQQLVTEVLKARDERFRHRLSEYTGNATDVEALKKIYEWHMQWFQTDHFKGCLFVRAVGESSAEDEALIEIVQQHKQWIRAFIRSHIVLLKHSDEVSELSYNLLEGLISRFLVEHYDQKIADQNWALLHRIILSMQH